MPLRRSTLQNIQNTLGTRKRAISALLPGVSLRRVTPAIKAPAIGSSDQVATLPGLAPYFLDVADGQLHEERVPCGEQHRAQVALQGLEEGGEGLPVESLELEEEEWDEVDHEVGLAHAEGSVVEVKQGVAYAVVGMFRVAADSTAGHSLPVGLHWYYMLRHQLILHSHFMKRAFLCGFSAPGKAIFSGEHSVLYGHPALVGALHSRTHLYLFRNDQRQTKLVQGKNAIILGGRRQHLIGVFIDTLLAKEQEKVKQQWQSGVTLLYKNQIPLAKGLGSSAAVSVAISACLLRFRNQALGLTQPVDLQEVNRCAFELEKITHGNPSGIDNTVSTFGGSLKFKMNAAPEQVKISRSSLRVVLRDSGLPKSTKLAVQQVRKYVEANGRAVIDSIGAVTESIVCKLGQNNPEQVMRLVDQNHRLLATLGLSNQKIEQQVSMLRASGLAAKLVGSGLGGFVMGYGQKTDLPGMTELGGAGLREQQFPEELVRQLGPV